MRKYIIAEGDIISGIATHRNMEVAKISISGGTLLRMRPGVVSELSLQQAFEGTRCTVLIDQIWGVRSCRRDNPGDIGRVWVRGYLSQEDSRLAGTNLPVRCRQNRTVRMKPDPSCRGQDIFPWIQEDGWEGLPVIRDRERRKELHSAYVVLGQQDWYPGRSA